MPTYDFVIPGSYFCDLIFTGFPHFPELGTEIYTDAFTVTAGGVLNTVVALNRLGMKTAWLGAVGNDFFSRYALETAEQSGVDTRLIQHLDAPLQRVTVAISYPNDRAFVTYVDNTPPDIDLLAGIVDTVDTRHLHFPGLVSDPRTPEVLQRARARGISISMDCQHRPETLDTPPVRDVLAHLDIFMPNASEARRLTGEGSLDAAVARLREIVPFVVIKDGANGAYAWRGNQTLHAPALDVTPLDTTGAGDVFNAGFLTAYLDGRELLDCLRWGNVCGGLSTLGHGGTATAPDRAQVEARLGLA
jgi:sugar/nucleoside kinase (ribokinase family)